LVTINKKSIQNIRLDILTSEKNYFQDALEKSYINVVSKYFEIDFNKRVELNNDWEIGNQYK
jgi:hypothetical protein